MTRSNGVSEHQYLIALGRDQRRCQRCGTGGHLELHHRRGKAAGGSRMRRHTECLCNYVFLCGRGNTSGCHGWAHQKPLEARESGFVVRQVREPLDVPVLTFWGLRQPTCDGLWVAA